MGYLRQYSPFMQLATIFGIWIGFVLITQFGMVAFFPAISGGYTMDQYKDPAVWNNPGFLYAMKLFQVIYSVVAFLVPGLLFAYLTHPEPATYLGLKQKPRFFQLLLALLIMFCSLPLVGAMSEWNGTWPISQSLRDLEESLAEQTKRLLYMPDIGSMLLNLFMLALLPAVAEEVLFRGVVQRILTPMVKNGWLAAIITGVLFSAIHFQFLGFMPRFLLGFLMGAIYFVTGNLWLSIAGHFLNNGLQVVLVYLYQIKLISYDATKDEHVPLYFVFVSLGVTGILLWQLRQRAKLAGQTFELPPEPDDEEEKEDNESIFKD
ncbi:CPBP family intramembrane metalloprotease [Chitinophaga sp. SYP-B3965]|uniref:CPBP family intramembrane glutamic endopeptidase n=1 Tax=Chitinophaga sp. SYP-B3965 TaxID=2663120 RepID=UPI001299F198|nr:CPBP family intramembrane glutamic endopeptidase [Chitinophaga sp. SYP-B3965]MRG46594.1 CPBP family intramembrane metalloprotease [Chitinophaga sp. SYP-B3965]